MYYIHHTTTSMYTVHCTLYNEQFVHSNMISVLSMYAKRTQCVQCRQSVHISTHYVHCTVYNVQCTTYTYYEIKLRALAK